MMSAKNFKTPTLVVHGQLDYRLDVSEGFQLFDTLQRFKVPSKMLYFPDEGHWVLKPQNSRLWWKTVNDWVDQWTKAGNRGVWDIGSRRLGTINEANREGSPPSDRVLRNSATPLRIDERDGLITLVSKQFERSGRPLDEGRWNLLDAG